MSDDLVKAISLHVEKEMNAARESIDTRINEGMKQVWKDIEERYRSRIVTVLAVALAVMVGGFSVSAITATREANSAVIEFQNTIMARQKAMIDSEDRLSMAVRKLAEAETKHNIATDKLKNASDNLEKVTGEFKEAKRKYEELYDKLIAQK